MTQRQVQPNCLLGNPYGNPWGNFALTSSSQWRRGVHQGLPFTTQNRPWLTSDCIEAMNEAFMVCISKIEPEKREYLRDCEGGDGVLL
jgi:hypothetical protein